MNIKTALLTIGSALAATVMASPAHADIYTYGMNNGGTLKINTATNSGTYVASDINVSFTSTDFATFAGGAAPTFMSVLNSLDGLRLVNGNWLADNPLNATTTHPQKLIFSGSSVNLWAWWGNPIAAGDYVQSITSYSSTPGTSVPEPGMLGLFGLGVIGLMAGNRRRRVAAKSAPKLAMA